MRIAWAITVLAVALAQPATAAPTGQQTFAAQCSLCHQSDGGGLAGQFPRLAGRVPTIASNPEGRRYLATVLLYGMYGAINVDGTPISGMMPAVGSLSDQAVADVLNHLLTLKPARKVAPFTAAEIALVRAADRKGGSEVAAERTRLAGLGIIP